MNRSDYLAKVLYKLNLVKMEHEKENAINKMKLNEMSKELQKCKENESLLKLQLTKKNNSLEQLTEQNLILNVQNLQLNEQYLHSNEVNQQQISKMNEQNLKLTEQNLILTKEICHFKQHFKKNENEIKMNYEKEKIQNMQGLEILKNENETLKQEIKNLKEALNSNSSFNRTLHSLGTKDIFEATKTGILEPVIYWIMRPPVDYYYKKTPLHYAAELGFDEIANFLCTRYDLEIKDGDGFTPLHRAVMNKNSFNCVKFLIEHGANIESLNSYKSTPLHWACEKGHSEIIEYLLSKGANIEARDENGNMPIVRMWTLEMNDDERLSVLKILVANGANVSSLGKECQTPLHKAYKWKNENCIHYLISCGADQDTRDYYNKLPKDYKQN